MRSDVDRNGTRVRPSAPHPLSDAELEAVLKSALTSDERESAAVYLLDEVVASGTTLRFGAVLIHAPSDMRIAFVDREPTANWGHSARYLLIDRETAQVASVEARFPPFLPANARRWRIAFRAPSPVNTFVPPSRSDNTKK